MNNPDPKFTKICSSCGQRKHLTAFAHLAGGYGNICSSCRKTAFEQPKEQDESTRSTTGVKIDAKLKVKEAADRREIFKQIKENYQEEREKLEEKKIQRTEKIKHVADGEKKHRSFLEKRSFLDRHSKNVPAAAPIPGGEEQKAAAGKLDFTGPVEFTRVAGQVKTQSSAFLSFKTWLGTAAPIVSAAEKAAKQKNNAATAPKADGVSEYLHRNRPKSK